jgi:putative ABC transport system permease protein
MRSEISDFGYSLRRLSRSPGFTLTAILLLGLAIASNACVFAIFYCLLYKPLPYPESDRLVTVVLHLIKENREEMMGAEDIVAFSHLRDTFDRVGAFARNTEFLQNGPDSEPTRVQMVFMEPVVLDLLGLQPLAGRLPDTSDIDVRDPGRIWVSAQFATERFGNPARAIGGTLALRYGSYQIVGVLRSNSLFSTTQIWMPVKYTKESLAASADLRWGYAMEIGRLAPGVSRDEASHRLTALANTLPDAKKNPFFGDIYMSAGSLRSLWSNRYLAYVIQLLMSTALVIMVITAFNVSNLYLARLAARRHESVLIAALGAGSGRLMRLHGMDALVLSGCSLALGMLLAPSGLILLRYFDLLPAVSPYPIAVDGMTVLFSIAIALTMFGALVGSALWMQRRGGHIQDVLKEAGNRQSGGQGIRLVRLGLTLGQVALTITLLVGAGLLMRSAERVLHEDMGFDRRHLIFTGINLAADPAPYEEVVRAVFDRVLNFPGVDAGTLAECNPVGNPPLIATYQPIGSSNSDTTRWPKFNYCQDTQSNYFSLMGIQLVSGRPFTSDETRSGAAVAIVDQQFAASNFPEGRALGRVITLNVPADNTTVTQWISRSVTIVGVVANVKSIATFLNFEALPAVYTPGRDGSAILLRSSMALPALFHALKAALHEVSPPAMMTEPVLVEERLDDFVRARYPLNALLIILSIATLTLASVGLYAVLAYSVRMRSREFGIRLALGESGAGLRRDVVVQGLRWAGIGALIAVPFVWILSRALSSQLYGVAPLDLLTLISVFLIVGTVSLLASWWPARAASKVDPLSALRAE